MTFLVTSRTNVKKGREGSWICFGKWWTDRETGKLSLSPPASFPLHTTGVWDMVSQSLSQKLCSLYIGPLPTRLLTFTYYYSSLRNWSGHTFPPIRPQKGDSAGQCVHTFYFASLRTPTKIISPVDWSVVCLTRRRAWNWSPWRVSPVICTPSALSTTLFGLRPAR